MNQIIELIVAPNGQTRIQTHGFTGQSCRQASQFIESALGQRLGEQLTAEFHQVGTDRATLREGRQV